MNSANKFITMVKHPLKFRLFLFWKLPAAFFSGVRIAEFDESHAVTSIPYKWLTQNPFKSAYFASLSMAAELSTGVLAMMNIYERKPSVSMLVTKMEAEYFKKVTGKTFFSCFDGEKIIAVVEEAIVTKQSKSITVKSTGTNKNNEVVATFLFTWSFRAKLS